MLQVKACTFVYSTQHIPHANYYSIQMSDSQAGTDNKISLKARKVQSHSTTISMTAAV